MHERGQDDRVTRGQDDRDTRGQDDCVTRGPDDPLTGWKKLLVTGLGSGYLPIAPGTWGSLPPVLIWLVTVCLIGELWSWRWAWLIATLVMFDLAVMSSVICVKLGPFVERAFGKKDPGRCVIDEWAGQAVTLLALPAVLPAGLAESTSLTWLPLDLAVPWQGALMIGAMAFLAFRFFDIVKPPPARWMEKLPLGWGVLLDDVVAGLYANLVCQLVLRVWSV